MSNKSVLVKDYMARTLVTFKPDTDVLDAIHVLVNKRIADYIGPEEFLEHIRGIS